MDIICPWTPTACSISCRAFADERVEYVLVGGVALNLHGLVRATEDVDVFVRSDERNVERVRAALRRVWDDPAIDEIVAADLAGDYPVVRYGPPGETMVIDLMSRLGTEIAYDDLAVEVIDVRDVRVRIATPDTLYRMKRATVRAIDRADAEALRRFFSLEVE